MKKLGKRTQKLSISQDTWRAGGIWIVVKIWRYTGQLEVWLIGSNLRKQSNVLNTYSLIRKSKKY